MLDEKDETIDRLKTYIKTLKGQLTGLQDQLKYWVKKYGKIDNLVKGGGDK